MVVGADGVLDGLGSWLLGLVDVSGGFRAMPSSLILFWLLCFDVWQDGKTPLAVACTFENRNKKGEVEALLRAAGAK